MPAHAPCGVKLTRFSWHRGKNIELDCVAQMTDISHDPEVGQDPIIWSASSDRPVPKFIWKSSDRPVRNANQGAGAMAFRAHLLLRHVKYDELTEEQRADLKQRFEEHKRDLQTAIKAVNHGLSRLKAKPRRAPRRRRSA
jgi:hypothetical protein